VIGTGGTFAMQGRSLFDWVEYGESGTVLPVSELLSSLPPLELGVEPVPIEFRAIAGTRVRPADWRDLAELIVTSAARNENLAGFVVTHGTATLEETAWFLQLVLAIDRPVVLTGAQRPPNTAGSDAAANLRAAIAVAASPEARGHGVLVVMDNLVFAARDVTKSSSAALDAFVAPEFGPLGRVEADGHVSLRRVPAPGLGRVHLPLPAEGHPLPRVDIVTSYAGADHVAIDAFVAAGAQGLVSAGLVPGRPADGERDAFRAAVSSGVVVVQSTRAPRGNVPAQAFLERDGVLAGADLSPHKLRILLMLALPHMRDPAALQQLILAV
jgi:L-asparaginase